MTIKRKIQSSGIFLFICIVIISGIFLIRDVVVQRAENGVSEVSSVASDAMALYSLTQDYIQNPSQEAQLAWESKNRDVQQALDNRAITAYGSSQSFLELKKNSNTIGSLFILITESPNNNELRARQANEIMLRTKSFATESDKLAKAIFDDSEAVRKWSSAVLLVLLEFLFVGIIIFALYINTTVFVPLAKLTKAIRKVEGGDLSVNVPNTDSNNEIGILGRTFNSMARRLSIQAQGLRKEKVKDEVMLKDLGERITQLEDSRKAMANLLDDFEKEQKALSEAKAKDDAMLNSIGEGMLAVDSNKIIIAINSVAENLFGLKKGEALGKKYYEVFDDRDAENNPIQQGERPIDVVLSTGRKFTTPLLAVPVTSTLESSSAPKHTYPIPVYYTRNDGTKFPVALIVTPIIVNTEIAGAINIFRDVTREQEIEKLRVDFLALASHQLRTPLSGTKWLIETMQRGVLGELNERQKEYVGQLYQVNERMITLVSDMLNVLKLENAAPLASVEKYSVKKLFEDLVAITGPAAKKQGVTLVTTIDGDQDLIVETSLQMLRSSMEGLVSNAINYSEGGKEVVLGARSEADGVLLSVKDSGIGIPKAEQKRIFERFYRASNAKIARPEGSGLGLYTAALLADIIGATISFESQEGKGSIFYLRLPKQIIKAK